MRAAVDCGEMDRGEVREKIVGGETGVLVGLDLPWRVGELKQGSDPHIRAIV